MTTIYLLRHGETAWNADGNRYCGRTDLPLSAAGRGQAEALRGALATVPLAVVYASPLARARETGEIVRSGRNLPLDVDARLIEVDFGGWEGLTAAEIAVVDGDGRAAWLRDPTAARAGDTGETGGEVAARMGACLRELAERHDGEAIAVVGHNTSIRLFLAEALGMPLRNYRRLGISNASISEVELDGVGVRLLRLNDVAHLGSERGVG